MTAGRRALVAGSLAALALAGVAGCRQEAPRHHRIHVVDFGFSPPEIIVRPGDSVTWINDDPVPHTVDAVDGALTSGRMDARATFTYVVQEAGDIAYVCLYHPTMTATLSVR